MPIRAGFRPTRRRQFEAGYRSFDELLGEADFVSLHPQLSPRDAPPDERRGSLR